MVSDRVGRSLVLSKRAANLRELKCDDLLEI